MTDVREGLRARHARENAGGERHVTPARTPVRTYTGPTCPRCSRPLDHATLQDGNAFCPHCGSRFEARVFYPNRRTLAVQQIAQQVSDQATPCAYHERNAAVAACERCGVFICSLCEMTTDSGKLCPSCFDRLAQETAQGGATQTRIRDYGSLAMLSAGVGLLMAVILGIPGGILAWYFAIKAWRNPEQSSAGPVRLILAMLIGLLDTAFGGLILYSFIAAFTK